MSVLNNLDHLRRSINKAELNGTEQQHKSGQRSPHMNFTFWWKPLSGCCCSCHRKVRAEDEAVNVVFPLLHTKFTVVPLRRRVVFIRGPPRTKNIWLQYITNTTTNSLIKIWQKRDCNHSREPPLKPGKHDSYIPRGSFSLYLWVSAVFQRDHERAGEAGALLSRKPADGKMKSFHPGILVKQ